MNSPEQPIIFADDFLPGEVEQTILAIAAHLGLTIYRSPVEKSECGQTEIRVEREEN